MVSQMPSKMQNEQHKKDNKSKGTWTKISDDLNLNYLQLKAQEQLMECPDATRNVFSTHNIQEDSMLQVCSKFLHDVK